MLNNLIEFKRNTFLRADKKNIAIDFSDYNSLMNDLFFLERKSFIKKYKLDSGLTTSEFHLLEKFYFKTFDKGEIEIDMHKYDGDYEFIYRVISSTPQSTKIQEEFEPSWMNEDFNISLH